MKKFVLLFVGLLFVQQSCFAQPSRYIIQLKDKEGSPYNINSPSQFLTQPAVDRRTRYHIAVDATDLPVIARYIDSIRSSGDVTILNVSKWFNTVSIQTTDTATLAKINSFPFVITSKVVGQRPVAPLPFDTVEHRPTSPNDVTDIDYGQSYAQIHIHNGEFLHKHNFKGDGMILTLTDDGFPNYRTLPTFDSVRNNNQILGTWDFVARDTNVSDDDRHGLECFSTIAANMPGTFVGAAPHSSFYLYRTEDIFTEYPIEMYNWLAAAERADSLGVDVISVSLGYTTFDNNIGSYTYSDLDGNTTVIARGVNMASRKGILVVAAAGNSGDDVWHYVETPGDADSALSVGAIDINEQPAYFTSFGPNSSGQTKPDVVAIGLNAVVADVYSGMPMFAGGTSFACPTMAGLATCLWQAFPEVNNMKLIDVLRRASDLSEHPDNRKGCGVPDLKKAFVELIKQLHTQQVIVGDDKAKISWAAKSAADMNFVVERKLSSDADYVPIDTQSVNSNFVLNNFTYTDDLSSQTGIIHYRIKMNIAADTSFYLDSTVINYGGTVIVYPNPVTDDLTIFITQKNAATIGFSICSSTGQLVYASSYEQPQGVKIYTIPFKKYSNGVYVLTVYANNNKIAAKKIVH